MSLSAPCATAIASSSASKTRSSRAITSPVTCSLNISRRWSSVATTARRRRRRGPTSRPPPWFFFFLCCFLFCLCCWWFLFLREWADSVHLYYEHRTYAFHRALARGLTRQA